MKKTVTKIVCAALAATMCTALFASCGKEKEEAFFIGATGPLSGDNRSYGISVNNGANMAVEEINKAGGLNGYPFKFEMKDDQAEATPAANAYTDLYEAGMQVSLGSVTSGSCIAFANEAKNDNVFFMTPSATAEDAVADSNAYRVCFSDPDQGRISAETLGEKYTKIGVIYDSSDTYSSGIYKAFKEKIKEYSGVTVVEKSFAENKVTFSQQVSDLKLAKCDVVFLPIYYQQANLIIKEAVDAQNWQPEFFGCDGLDGLKKEMGDTIDKVENVISYMTSFTAEGTDEKTKTFVAAYKAKYDTVPDQFAANGYDAVYILYEAMKKADVKDVNISASDLCEILKATISAEDFSFSGVTGPMTWDASGAPTKTPVIVKLTEKKSA